MSSRAHEDEERRKTCLWLAELASLRPDVVARLVHAFGTFPRVLDRRREEIGAALPRPRAGEPRPGGERADEPQAHGPPAPFREASEGAAWRAALARCEPLDPAPAPKSAPPVGMVVAYVDPLYPSRLRALEDPPPAVFVLGGADAESVARRLEAVDRHPCVAVVGTRRPSQYGLDMARGIAGDLVAEGAVVVSGLAIGIDAAAHRGALDGGDAGHRAPDAGGSGDRAPGAGASGQRARTAGEATPRTVAVVGCGADICYPPAHRSLRERVLEEGIVVSEFTWGTPARAWRFPARNRIMAALVDAVVVVEGAANSGALITARRAEHLGRMLLAVPGESGRRVTEGPHALLRRGATLCESGACVRRAFAYPDEPGPARAAGAVTRWVQRREDAGGSGVGQRPATPAGDALPPVEAAVLAAVDGTQQELDGLLGVMGLPAAVVLAALGALEVRGLVAPAGGGRYRAVRGRGVRAR